MMNEKCKCENCGAPANVEYEAPFQEYPGAKVWGGTWYAECEKCGWDKLSDQDLRGYSIRENTRGW
jgi:hypothetical protein